jgi:hypothetical protein
MLDVTYVGIVIVFFAIAIAYARACDSGMGAG